MGVDEYSILDYAYRSDVIWEEQKKKGRWKALKMRLCDELEAAWTRIRQDEAVGASASYTFKSGDLEVTNNDIETKAWFR